ncbi:MAG: filamentous hemagglutinin N-terminal domain-containing protein, partial [Candidatus Omnitrophota bacterium]
MKIHSWRKCVLLTRSFISIVLATTFLVFYQDSAIALPEGQVVESGDASFDYSPDNSTLNITAADNTVINFQSFNIAANEAVNFLQPSGVASVLARVLGGGPSVIAGSLSANGMLFLTNAAGIHFTPTANVNVNNFAASSLDIATQNFLSGNYVFERGANAPYAEVSNEGTMIGNNIALMASRVKNTGSVVARVGTLHLASGDKTTVSFDAQGLINVVVDVETGSGTEAGETIAGAAIENSGTLEGKHVVLDAQVARGLFQKAVNQTGIVRATGIVEENGVLRIVANRNIEVSGTLEAASGKVEVVSQESVTVPQALQTTGDTEIKADGDINVYADLTTLNGDLVLLADADLNGVGAFHQAEGTTLSTVNFGDIRIQASGESTLGNVNSAGDLILQQGGAPVTFTQLAGSLIVTKGSIVINSGVTMIAANAVYEIGKDWVNLGNFIPQTSAVHMVSQFVAQVIGSNTFFDLVIEEPGKIVQFDSEETQTILGTLTVKGSYGNLVSLGSIEPPKQWRLNALGLIDVMFAYLGDCINIRGPPVVALHSDSSGNLTNFVVNVLWTGNGLSGNWSDSDNWDTGVVPGSYSHVVFEGATGLNPHKDSLVDSAFLGALDSLTLDGYAGTLTLGRDLTLSGDFNHQTGGFDPSTYGVEFVDASKPSHIYGDNTFYNLTCVTPSKVLYFEAGKTQTILGTFKIQGAYNQHVRLISTQSGSRWLVDPQGVRDLTYAWVEDSHNVNPTLLVMTESTNRGNSVNWDPTATWTGTNSALWNDGGNWSGLGGAAPGAGDDLVFPDVSGGSNRYSLTNDYLAGTPFNSLTFTASGYTLAGNAIELGAGGITDSAASGSNTISLGMTLNATRTMTVTNSGESLTLSGVISGSGGLTKAGAGSLILSNANTYSGTTTLNAGTLYNGGNASALGTGAFTITGGTYDANGQATTITGLVTVSGGEYQAKAGTQTLNGGLTLSGTGIFTGAAGTVDVTDVMVGSGATLTAPASLYVSGNWAVDPGATFTSGSNTVTFDGATTGKTLATGGKSFYDLTFNAAGGEWAVRSDITVARNLTITAGTLDLSNYGLSVDGTTTIDTSTSSGATLNSTQRKSFFDTVNNRYWVFYYAGSGVGIEYAYSIDGSSWTTVASTLSYDSTNFALTYRSLSGSGYVFLVSENNSYDVSLSRGLLSSNNITFDAPVTVFDGSAATDKFVSPTLTVDADNYLWVASKYVNTNSTYQISVRQSTNTALGDLSSWQATSYLGIPQI